VQELRAPIHFMDGRDVSRKGNPASCYGQGLLCFARGTLFSPDSCLRFDYFPASLRAVLRRQVDARHKGSSIACICAFELQNLRIPG
jgi:hypothetical protein